MIKLRSNFVKNVYYINKLKYSLSAKHFKNFDIFNDESEISQKRLTSKQKIKPPYRPSSITSTTKTTADTHTAMSSEIGGSWLSKLTSDNRSEFDTRQASNQKSTFSDLQLKTKYVDLSVEDKTKIIDKLMDDRAPDEILQIVVDKYWQQLLDAPSYSKLGQLIR